MDDLRSADWYLGDDRNAYIHRAWMRRGNPVDALDSTKPQIAIANTASDLTPCNKHLNEVAESVKNGIWEAGGVPYNLPVVSLGETQVKPTAMLWRNMAAMAMEEMFRANPIDGLVLLGGCDKTIPALLMAAASVNLPAVVVPGGPMLTGHASHQVGLDADIWLTPAPDYQLSRNEREDMSAVMMVRADRLDIEPSAWTPRHFR